MKINVEVDLEKAYGQSFDEWITHEYYERDTGYTEVEGSVPKVEEIIFQKAFDSIIEGVKSSIEIEREALNEQLQQEANENVRTILDNEIEGFAKKTLDQFLSRTLIEVKQAGWSNEISEISVDEYIENKIDSIFKKKMYDSQGKKPNYDRDAKYSMMELIISDRIIGLVEKKFEKVYQVAMAKMEAAIKNTISLKLTEKYISDNRVTEIVEAVYKELDNQTNRKEIVATELSNLEE